MIHRWAVPLCLAVVLALAPRASADIEIAMPEEAAVGDPVHVTMTGPPNASFLLQVQGTRAFGGFSAQAAFDEGGVYTFDLPPMPEGEYFITVSSGNMTATRTIDIVCSASCQADRTATALKEAEARFMRILLALVVVQVMLIAVLLINAARDKEVLAQQLGLPRPTLNMWRRIRQVRFIMSPGIGASRLEANPRRAFQAEKERIRSELMRRFEDPPVGRDPQWEFATVNLMRSYVVADRQVADTIGQLTEEGETEDAFRDLEPPKVAPPPPEEEDDVVPKRKVV